MIVYYVVTILVVLVAALGQQAAAAAAGGASEAGTERAAPGLAVLVVAVVLALVSSLRWRVGTDYVTYSLSYYSYKTFSWQQVTLVSEPGIRLLARVGSWVWDDPGSMFALAAVATIVPTVRTLARSTNLFTFAVALYILSGAWQGSFNGVRQYIACAIVFAGHHLILERRWWAYVGVVLLAAAFHISAIVLLLLYFVPRRKLGVVATVVMIGAGVAAIGLYSIFGNVVDDVRAGASTGSYFFEQVSPLRVAFAFAPWLLYLVFAARGRLSSIDHFYANLMLLHAVVFLSALNSAYVARFSIYTGIYISVALPRLIATREPLTRWVLTAIVLVVFAVFWYLDTSSVPALSNFRWIFDR